MSARTYCGASIDGECNWDDCRQKLDGQCDENGNLKPPFRTCPLPWYEDGEPCAADQARTRPTPAPVCKESLQTDPAPVGQQAVGAVARGAMEACVEVTQQLAAARAENAEKDAEIERLRDAVKWRDQIQQRLDTPTFHLSVQVQEQVAVINTLVKSLRGVIKEADRKTDAFDAAHAAIAAADAWKAKWDG
jgi:hypothetical protein